MTRIKTRALFGAVLIASAVALTAQVPPRDQAGPASTGTAEISGSVLTAAEPAQPVRRAVVALVRSGTEDARTTISDERGQYVFASLPAGRYTLSAKKDSMLFIEYGAVRFGQPGSAIVLTDGQRFVAKPMTLTPGGVVAGRVTDRNGRGISNLLVRASGVVVVGGERRERATSVFSATTNAHGEYRIFGLLPGEYVVHASAPAAVETAVTPAELAWATRPEGPAPPPGRPLSLASTMFPGTVDANAAQIIALVIGEQRVDLDFRLQSVPVARVTVNVTGLDGLPARGGTLTQTPKRSNPFAVVGINRAPVAGSHVFTGVTPGEYVYVVRGDSRPVDAMGRPVGAAETAQILWALAEATVAGEDITIDLRLRPALSVSGRIDFQSASGAAQPDSSRVSVRVDRLDPGGGNGGGTARADGTFTVNGLIPGASQIGASISGEASTRWFVSSAMFGGVDLLDEPLQVGTADASNIVITFTDSRTQIAGTLTDAAGQPAPLYILLFPVDREYWKGGSRRIAFARANDAGRYEINGFPPGQYYLCALTEIDTQLLFAPAYLDQLQPAAIKIAFGEGEKKTQNLQIGR